MPGFVRPPAPGVKPSPRRRPALPALPAPSALAASLVLAALPTLAAPLPAAQAAAPGAAHAAAPGAAHAAAPGAAQPAAPGGTQGAVPCAPGSPDPRIVVRVVGARNGQGEMAITLYGERRADFLARGGRLARVRLPLRGATAIEACFAVSVPGAYAVAVYHDENGDHDFNRTLLGLPAEGFGFSRDAPTTVGLPSFSDAVFPAGPGTTRMVVTLRYL